MSLDVRDQPFKEGDKVFGVTIRRLIGKGGQAYVYEAIRSGLLKEPVALKAIPNTLDSTRNIRQRAESEARLLDKLNHQNVVRVHAADVTEDGVVCIVMEMLRGRSMRAMLRELNRIRVDEALLIGAQIAEGVHAAHELNAIHRDLKPENVYIEPGNVVKVLDFGIAKIVGLGTATTQENQLQGTVQYMCPEHLQARPVTARSDIFALGCVLYELLSGSTPAAIGHAANLHDAAWYQILHMPPQLDTIADVPANVAHAIQLMLAKEPSGRPATMSQVATELRSLYTRYTTKTGSVPRELWHEGAGALPPIPRDLVPMTATTTIPEAAAQHNATKPMPLMVRNPISEPEPHIPQRMQVEPKLLVAQKAPVAPEPSVVVREMEAPAQAAVTQVAPAKADSAPVPVQVAPAKAAAALAVAAEPMAAVDSLSEISRARMRAVVAGAEKVVSQQKLQQTPPATGARAFVAPRRKPRPGKEYWYKVVAAVGGGTFLGAVTLSAMYLVSAHKSDANAEVSAGTPVSAVVAPTPLARPSPTPVRTVPSATATPKLEASVANVHEPNVAMTPPPEARKVQPATSAAPTASRSIVSTKPAQRKPKSPAGKLPFTSDDLTF